VPAPVDPAQPAVLRDDEETALGARAPFWLARPSDGLRYLAFCRVYAFGSALRLVLPDATADAWLGVSLVHWLGVALVAFNGCLLGWVLCLGATATALVTLEDQLTKSAFLLACALSAVIAFAGSARERRQRIDQGLALAVRCITIAVYAFAVFHKLNRDYFDPGVSCANGGLVLLFDGWPPAVQALAAWAWWPRLQVAAELAIVGLLWWRPAWGVVAASLMHVPLTIIFAPAFVFVMMSGWVCFFGEAELRALWRTLRRRSWVIVLVGGALGATTRALFFPGRWSTDPDWCVQEVLLWMVVVWLLEAVTTRGRPGFHGRMAWSESTPRGAIGRAAAVTTLFALNGLTPYLGIQFHHTGAMLSNLRIDDGCTNSWVMPAALRLGDPYVRIDRIDFAPGRAAPGVTESITKRLWAPEALWRARHSWCAVHDEPLPVAGTWRGKSFELNDLCAPDGWPFGKVWLPGMRRFQVNLERQCPQRCVH
jgi:hypothetical protein